MFYRLSNTAEKFSIEESFDAKFVYPELYTKEVLINGFDERNLPIICMEDTETIRFAIWGLLPQQYREGWKDFQNLSNTLNISFKQIEELDWIEQLFSSQRCAIVVSGFFTSYLYKGESYPFYVYEKNNKPFALAGMFSQLDDGFLTVSLLTAKTSDRTIESIHNLGKTFPVALHFEHYTDWLDDDLNFNSLNLDEFKRPDLKVHPISRKIYNEGHKSENVLKPKHYDNLPKLSVVW
ncbi:SOS response-associated peptidase family protein [Winogradskyella sp. A3E31]|uniref:SOS response-associated peptidase family protein n=1 Tax=Winogradskyella sp. A3E31 TaxID=3349637 RepID=UPI00398ABDE9